MLSVRLASRLIAITLLGSMLIPAAARAEVYELRTYTTNDGKLGDLNARFRDHTVELFQKHGMESVGYWVPTDGEKQKNTLIYVLKHKSMDAAKVSWQAFLADPIWKQAYKNSEADGPILAKAPESVYMNATDYSPEFTAPEPSDQAVYELRIYRCNEGKLGNLNARFRDHTIDLFNRH